MEKIPPDVEFNPESRLSWSQQVGVAILKLTQDQSLFHVTWLIEVSSSHPYMRSPAIDGILTATWRNLGYTPTNDSEYGRRAQRI